MRTVMAVCLAAPYDARASAATRTALALWLRFRSDERSEIIQRLDHETDAQVLGEAGYLIC